MTQRDPYAGRWIQDEVGGCFWSTAYNEYVSLFSMVLQIEAERNPKRRSYWLPDTMRNHQAANRYFGSSVYG